MDPGNQLKYGWIKGGKVSVEVPMAASQDVLYESSKFVYMNEGLATLCTDGTGQIFGHLEYGEGTPTLNDMLNCITDLSAVFKMPISTGHTYNANMVGEHCDIEMDVNGTGIQSAQLDAHDDELLIIVGGDATNSNWVLVMINPNQIGEVGVTE